MTPQGHIIEKPSMPFFIDIDILLLPSLHKWNLFEGRKKKGKSEFPKEVKASPDALEIVFLELEKEIT